MADEITGGGGQQSSTPDSDRLTFPPLSTDAERARTFGSSTAPAPQYEVPQTSVPEHGSELVQPGKTIVEKYGWTGEQTKKNQNYWQEQDELIAQGKARGQDLDTQALRVKKYIESHPDVRPQEAREIVLEQMRNEIDAAQAQQQPDKPVEPQTKRGGVGRLIGRFFRQRS